jgi:hypothetical protein
MPNEPLALPDILTALPDAADYETIYAAVMASERGRRFLAEHADRNRQADTHMVVGAIARVEAAIRGEPAPRQASASVGYLEEIAAAIACIEAEIAAGKPAPPYDVFAALECIQDIAFVLHERPVEPTLCDRLDAAVRMISDALAQSHGGAESGQAIELLRALASRVRDMIAAGGAGAAAAENAAEAVLPPGSSAESEADSSDSFHEAVATLAASLPAVAEVTEPAFDPQGEPADAGSAPREAAAMDDIPERPDGAGPATPASSQQQVQPETIRADVGEALPTNDLAVEHVAPEQAATEASASAAILDQALAVEHFTHAELSSDAVTENETPSESASTAEPQSEGLLPSQNYSADVVVSPDEDPGDLFDPLPAPSLVGGTAVEAVAPPPVPTGDAPAAAELPPAEVPVEPPAEIPAEPPRAAAPSSPRAVARPGASDPLAAVRALSDEELIALFS